MFTARKVLAATVVLLLCSALLNQRYTAWLNTPVYNTVTTVQYPAGWLAASLGRSNPTTGNDDLADQSDEELERMVAELRDQLKDANRYNRELWLYNTELQNQLTTFRSIYEQIDIESIRAVQAKVSQYNADAVNPTIKLLRGKLHGVAVNDAVVYKTNLVGFVKEVGPATCTVTLITRKSYRTEVIINPPEQRRMENNWPAFARAESNGKGQFVCDLSDKIAKHLRTGDLVSVSDTLRATANGFVLGEITAIEAHPQRPLQDKSMIITPRTPIGTQQTVTILTQRTDDD